MSVKDEASQARTADILARTIFGEARGESEEGRQAVASVILNRVRMANRGGRKHWWGNNIEEVCRKPWQFSCWNPGDPNRAKIEAVTSRNKVFANCLVIANEAVAGRLTDPTGGATHYHEASINPPWAKILERTVVIGRHLFYKEKEKEQKK